MTSHRSRYSRVTQRAAINRKAVTHTAMAGALLLLPAACGNGDDEIFATATTIAATTDSVATDSTSEVTPEASAGATFPESAELLVSFTYQPSEDNQAKRPYVAVWVEDSDGNLVDTISLWFQQDSKGTKWLDDLQQWYSASGGNDTTMSGATRVAGDYVVAWDGTDADGALVDQGDYVLFVESSREHGDYSITSGTVTISDAGASFSLADDGELSGVSAELAV